MRVKFVIPVLASVLILGTLAASPLAFAVTEDAKLTASDATNFDLFGRAVSISGDTIVVGAPFDDDAGSTSGSAYVFTKSGTTWVEQAKLTASDGAAGDQFGVSVSISGDTIVVGAINDDDNGLNSGSAYVFERDASGNWIEVAKLLSPVGAVDDLFAQSVSVSGNRVIVGSHGEDLPGFSAAGAAYVFERDASGNWIEVAKLLASDGSQPDNFGFSVSLSGNRAVIGAPNNSDDGPSSGSAYVFERDASGNWNEIKKLLASDAAGGDRFGITVSISGETIVVGAFTNDEGAELNVGSAYVFDRNNGGSDNWGEVTKLTASDATAMSQFGFSVSISGDTIVVDANADDTVAGENAGSAYVFDRNNGGSDNWGEVTKLTASDATSFDRFGISVSISNSIVVVGAFNDDDAGTNSGSAYVYELFPTFDSLREQIISLGLDDGLTNALISKVDAAEQQFEAGNNDTAINILNAYVNQAEAQTGKKIPDTDAAALINAANDQIDFISNQIP